MSKADMDQLFSLMKILKKQCKRKATAIINYLTATVLTFINSLMPNDESSLP